MSETVVVVFDRDFAHRLDELMGRDSWIVGSPVNSPAIEQIWKTDRDFSVTVFKDYGEPLEDAFDEILATVDLHHGEFSEDPPYRRVEVFGVQPDQPALASLARFGFELEAATRDGFVARRRGV